MFYKIIGTNGTKKKSYFTYKEASSFEEAREIIQINCLGLFATSLDSIEVANKDDKAFIKYIEEDKIILQKEIDKKLLLMERLNKALT